MKKLLTLMETADELGLTYGTVRQYVHWGHITARKVGKNKMVSWEEIERFKAQRRGEA